MKVTIGTCWDGRDYYPVIYVNKLYRAVLKYTNIPFEFVLYIGPDAEPRVHEIDPAIKIVKTGLPFWWSGVKFWQANAPEVNLDCLLFLDLDVVIVGSLDDLLLYPSNFAMMKDYPAQICPNGHSQDANTGITLIRNNAGAAVWDEYVKGGMPKWNPMIKEDDRVFPLAAQGIINDLNVKRDLFPENWVCSYKLHKVATKGLPEDCRIVHFHGRPKQHEVNDEFVKRYWHDI